MLFPGSVEPTAHRLQSRALTTIHFWMATPNAGVEESGRSNRACFPVAGLRDPLEPDQAGKRVRSSVVTILRTG